jgi:hypothetical protein
MNVQYDIKEIAREVGIVQEKLFKLNPRDRLLRMVDVRPNGLTIRDEREFFGRFFGNYAQAMRSYIGEMERACEGGN